MSAERELTDDIIEAIEKDLIKPAAFMYLDFPSGAQRKWTGQGPITFKGHVYDGVGGLIAVDTMTETTDTAAKGIVFRVNGLDASFVSRLTSDTYQGGDAVLEIAFFDDVTHELYVMPGPLWEGFMDSDNIQRDGKSADLQIKCEHALIDILRKREWQYNSSDQAALFPDHVDTFFDRIPTIQNYSIPWGRTQS